MKRYHFDNCLLAPNPAQRIKQPKQICPHCGKEGNGNSMQRWHFENCKLKGNK